MRPVIAILANMLRSPNGEFSTRDVTNRPYTEALLAAGAVPFILPAMEDSEAIETLLKQADGVLISGGEDVSPEIYGQPPDRNLGGVSPWRDFLDEVVVRYLLAQPELPILGICRGIQSLAAFAGGALLQDIPSQVPEAIQHIQKAPGFHGSHEIVIEAGSLLERVTGRRQAMVNSFHHQAVQEAPDGFSVSARTCDGVIEAIEKPQAKFCLGLQCHPELMAPRHPFAAEVFRQFVRAAGQ